MSHRTEVRFRCVLLCMRSRRKCILLLFDIDYDIHFMHSKKLTNKKQKIFPKVKRNQGWPVVLHPSKKQRNKGNAITKPRSHSYTFMMKYWSCNWCSHATVPCTQIKVMVLHTLLALPWSTKVHRVKRVHGVPKPLHTSQSCWVKLMDTSLQKMICYFDNAFVNRIATVTWF